MNSSRKPLVTGATPWFAAALLVPVVTSFMMPLETQTRWLLVYGQVMVVVLGVGVASMLVRWVVGSLRSAS